MTFDTICAVISAPGTAAVSLIRISGPEAFQISARHFSKAEKLLSSPSHSVLFGLFLDSEQRELDELLITKFIAPHSYTGEDVLELACHGNPTLVARIMEVLLNSCRLAHPGEFTQRAYLNGKLDLIQAEAVNDLIHAGSSKSSVSALRQLRGQLTDYLGQILERIQNARLRVELAIDFSDQDLPQIDLDKLRADLEELTQKAQDLYSESQNGRFLRDGIKLCLAGAPNVGKSSLFNAFLKSSRAIVSPHPGTTRDYLEESISLFGYTVVIYDTAGLRETSDEIESLGIDRSRELIEASDLVLYLHELSGFTSTTELLPGKQVIHIITKIDLLGLPDCVPARMPSESEWLSFLLSKGFDPTNPLPIPVSTILEGGLTPIKESILKVLKLPRELSEQPQITNSRQLAALGRTITALQRTNQALADKLGFEFIAFDLIEASTALQEILGSISTDDMLGEIFSKFCVGK